MKGIWTKTIKFFLVYIFISLFSWNLLRLSVSVWMVVCVCLFMCAHTHQSPAPRLPPTFVHISLDCQFQFWAFESRVCVSLSRLPASHSLFNFFSFRENTLKGVFDFFGTGVTMMTKTSERRFCCGLRMPLNGGPFPHFPPTFSLSFPFPFSGSAYPSVENRIICCLSKPVESQWGSA